MKTQSTFFRPHFDKLFPLGIVAGIFLGNLIGSIGVGVMLGLIATFLSGVIIKRVVLG